MKKKETKEEENNKIDKIDKINGHSSLEETVQVKDNSIVAEISKIDKTTIDLGSIEEDEEKIIPFQSLSVKNPSNKKISRSKIAQNWIQNWLLDKDPTSKKGHRRLEKILNNLYAISTNSTRPREAVQAAETLLIRGLGKPKPSEEELYQNKGTIFQIAIKDINIETIVPVPCPPVPLFSDEGGNKYGKPSREK